MGDEARELERLRARAYGRDADIAMDPAALARLRYLESRRAAAAIDPAAEAASAVPAERDPVIDEVPVFDGAPPKPPLPSVSAPEAVQPVSTARRRKVWPLVAIAVGGLVVGALATQLFAPAPAVSTETGAVLADTVRADPDLEWPTIFGPSGGDQRVWSYRGMMMSASTGSWYTYSATGEDCLVVMESADVERYLGPDADDGSSGWSIEGPQYAGCGAGAFPAAVQFVVESRSPTALLARFSEGTALQFVMDGDVLRVYESDD